MGKRKRKLTKEEKVEKKYRAGLGRLCCPGCTLIVFGKDYPYEQRCEMVDSGINIIFSNDVEETTEFLEMASYANTPLTLYIRTPFTENPDYFASTVEPLLSYIGKNVAARIFGHTPHDGILDKLKLREDDTNDRAFMKRLAKWAPYCTDTVGYGNRVKLMYENEVKQRTRIPAIYSEECMRMKLDPVELMEKIASVVSAEENAN